MLVQWFYTETVYPSAVIHPRSNHLIATRPGVEPSTSRSQVQRPNCYATVTMTTSMSIVDLHSAISRSTSTAPSELQQTVFKSRLKVLPVHCATGLGDCPAVSSRPSVRHKETGRPAEMYLVGTTIQSSNVEWWNVDNVRGWYAAVDQATINSSHIITAEIISTHKFYFFLQSFYDVSSATGRNSALKDPLQQVPDTLFLKT